MRWYGREMAYLTLHRLMMRARCYLLSNDDLFELNAHNACIVPTVFYSYLIYDSLNDESMENPRTRQAHYHSLTFLFLAKHSPLISLRNRVSQESLHNHRNYRHTCYV